MKETLKKILLPIVLSVRAIRAYRQMKHWRRNVVDGKLRIMSQVPEGIFTVDVRSSLSSVAFSGKYEERMMNRLPELKIGDGLIVNVGANIGFYAIQLARVFPDHSILAIEPNPEAFELLKQNVLQNGFQNRIQTVHACISDEKGKVELSYIAGSPEYSSMNGIVHAASSSQTQVEVEVDAFSLSDLVETQKVALIMMDVEGAEYLVLKGSKNVLTEHNPIILCECDDYLLKKFGHSSQQLTECLVNMGYSVYDEKTMRRFSHPFVGNILALRECRKNHG